MDVAEPGGCQAAYAQAQATLSSEQAQMSGYMPPLPPCPPPAMQGEWDAPSWGVQGYAPELPPVAGMLVREGNAWAALLQLHGTKRFLLAPPTAWPLLPFSAQIFSSPARQVEGWPA